MAQLKPSVPVVTALVVVPALTLTTLREPADGVAVAETMAEPAVKAVIQLVIQTEAAVMELSVITKVWVVPVAPTVMPVKATAPR